MELSMAVSGFLTSKIEAIPLYLYYPNLMSQKLHKVYIIKYVMTMTPFNILDKFFFFFLINMNKKSVYTVVDLFSLSNFEI